MTTERYSVSFWGDGNVLESVGTVARHCDCTKNPLPAHFKMVKFMLYEFYFNIIRIKINNDDDK